MTLKEIKIAEQKEFDGQIFPLVLVPEDAASKKEDVLEYVKTHREELSDLLLKYGAIVFRDCSFTTSEDFSNFVLAFDLEELPYVGGAAPRSVVCPRVFTTNESPPEMKIPFHHEMAQTPNPPNRVFFFCETPPKVGGQTPLAPSNWIYRKALQKNPEFVEKLEKEGAIYTRIIMDVDDPNSPIGRGWKSTYLVDTKEEAEEKAKSVDVSLEWFDNGLCKTTTKPIDSIRVDERTGKKMWFNSVIAAYTGWEDERNNPQEAVKYGDGSMIESKAIHDTLDIMNEAAVDVNWKTGDVFMLDNRTVMHARRPFEKPRRILASLTKTG